MCLAIFLDRRLFIVGENIHDVPRQRLGPGNDTGDIGILSESGVILGPFRFALRALLGFEALLFLPRSLFLTFEKRLATTISQ